MMNTFKRRIFPLLMVVALLVVGGLQPVAAQGERSLTVGSLVELYTIDPAVGFDQAIGSSLKQFYDALFTMSAIRRK